jgi:hypothetical protein
MINTIIAGLRPPPLDGTRIALLSTSSPFPHFLPQWKMPHLVYYAGGIESNESSKIFRE